MIEVGNHKTVVPTVISLKNGAYFVVFLICEDCLHYSVGWSMHAEVAMKEAMNHLAELCVPAVIEPISSN